MAHHDGYVTFVSITRDTLQGNTSYSFLVHYSSAKQMALFTFSEILEWVPGNHFRRMVSRWFANNPGTLDVDDYNVLLDISIIYDQRGHHLRQPIPDF